MIKLHFRVHSKYFYSKLSSQEKKIYDKILDAWLEYKETIIIPGLIHDIDYNKILDSIHNDNPELFYIDLNNVYVKFSPFNVTVSMKTRYPVYECESIKKKIRNTVCQVVEKCNAIEDRERYIHDFLVNNVSYASQSYDYDSHNIKGALLERKAVCEGYARSFKLLCDAVGIPCIVVCGNATNSDGVTEKHAWNIVRINRNNYHVDVTWDSNNKSMLIPLYYNVSDEYIERNHFWQKGVWPECVDNSELEKVLFSVTGKKSLGVVLKNAHTKRLSAFLIGFNRKFSSTDEVIKFISAALQENSISLKRFSVIYNPTLDCAIVQYEYW